MAGGLMQLVAYGAQDVYLTGSPKVTFFQAVYKKHTNFAMETIEQTVNGSAGSGNRISVTVARNGDLVGEMYLELETSNALTDVSANNAVDANWCAERAVESVELTVGGQRVDKHYQRWWRLYSELNRDSAKKAQYDKMTTAVGVAGQRAYLPLIFFFNRNPGLYLPLIALQYHEVRLDFELTNVYDNYFKSSPKVWANYVYLDTEERRRFAQGSHEYLIEQVQHTGTDSVSTSGSADQKRLSYNHPVKELVWCYTEESTVGDTNGLWNFTNDGVNVQLVCNLAADETMRPDVAGGCPHLKGVTTTNEGWLEEAPMGTNTHCGALDKFKLVLNGQDRFKEQQGKYFNQVQPQYHHSGNPYPGIYCYSFALKPEEHQPTGTCNFSRIDNAQVSPTLKSAWGGSSTATQHMFAVNYNVLRIQSGMGGLAFSN